MFLHRGDVKYLRQYCHKTSSSCRYEAQRDVINMRSKYIKNSFVLYIKNRMITLLHDKN